ncbi:MAG: hypothetical protein JWO06_408 [Bacteroidota bacterium]|nr:hypothetical protein [Bacteroidota bacterium]
MKSMSLRPGLFLALGFVILLMPEILKVYFIMPFPGSQHENHVELAYNINRLIWLSRIVGGGLFLLAAFAILQGTSILKKLGVIVLISFSAGIIYLTNFVMLADKMFYQPETKVLKTLNENKVDDGRSVIAVQLNGEAKAYPIYIMGYHHQVRDTVGGEPVMVTYCTVCRTGRVYKPEVDGKPETFRLVGMDEFNAMFEDATTKSWWRQATGECCAGPLKGHRLTEIPSAQMTLLRWKELNPKTLVMQPDPKFMAQYKSLSGYDDGVIRGGLVGTDSVSGQPKSWVVGVVTKGGEKLYDWNTLKEKHFINDVVGSEPIILVLEKDNRSFHAFSRVVNDSIVELSYDPEKNLLYDMSASDPTIWTMKGEWQKPGLTMPGLKPVQAYQEFYHSFTTFHPTAAVYK